MMKVKKLVMDAMLVAMYVALSLVSIKTGNMKITLDALPIIIGAILFGPVDGLVIGLLGSFLNQMLTYGFTATTVLWILPAGVRGLIVGLYARRKGFVLTHGDLFIVTIVSAVIVTTLNTVVMYIDSKIYGYYSFAYVFGTVILRYIIGIATMIVFSVILPPLLKAVKRYYFRQKDLP